MDLLKLLRLQWDRSAAVALTVVGVIVLIVGYFGVRHEAYSAGQIPYVVSGGIGALFLLGLAVTLWVSADLHDEWRKLDRLEDQLSRVEDLLSHNAPAQTTTTAALASPNGERPRTTRKSTAAASRGPK